MFFFICKNTAKCIWQKIDILPNAWYSQLCNHRSNYCFCTYLTSTRSKKNVKEIRHLSVSSLNYIRNLYYCSLHSRQNIQVRFVKMCKSASRRQPMACQTLKKIGPRAILSLLWVCQNICKSSAFLFFAGKNSTTRNDLISYIL